MCFVWLMVKKKTHMGYIYEALNRAKDTIVRSFNENEEKYNRYYRMSVKKRIFVLS